MKQLLAAGHHVRVFSRNMTSELNNFKDQVVHYPGSILNRKALLDACQGVSGIYHLAGLVLHSRTQNTADVYDINVDGTMNVMDVANEVKCKVVLASTSGTVGCMRNENFIADDTSDYCRDIVKNWPYYDSKIESEIKALEYSKKHDVPLVVLRPSSMYGPEDFYGRSTGTIKSYLLGKIPFIPPGGISYLDVRDAAKAFVTAMEKGRSGECYLLGSKNCSLHEFFSSLEIISGVKKPSISLYPWFVTNLSTMLDWYNRQIKGKWEPSIDPVKAEMSTHWWNIDWSKATEDLDFRPMDPIKTLEDTVEWLKTNMPEVKSKL